MLQKKKIEFYFIDGLFADNMFARPLLYVKAIDILNDFPFLVQALVVMQHLRLLNTIRHFIILMIYI